MTDPRRQRFAPYVRRLADAMALKDWAFEVDDDGPSDPNANGSVEPLYGRKVAVIRISDAMLGRSPETQRQTLVHELIHCHLEPARSVAIESLPGDLQPAFRRLSEYAVDGLADAMAPLLPLPEED